MSEPIRPMFRGRIRWAAHCLRFACHAGWELFASDKAKHAFLRCLDRARSQEDFDLWAFVILPDHVHVLLWPRKDVESMALIAEAIRQPMEDTALRRGLIPGPPFWDMGAPFDEAIEDVRAIHEAMRQIHDNPVRRGLVETEADWSYSSYRFWACLPHVPIEMDLTVPRLEDQDPDVF